MFARRSVVVLCIASAACASPNSSSSPAPAVETIRVPTATPGGTASLTTTTAANIWTVSRPIDRVWLVLAPAFDSLQIPLTTVDPTTHTIGNGDLRVRRRLGAESLRTYLNCGNTQGAPNAETFDIRLSVMAQLTPDGPGATTITTTIQAMARPASVSGEFIRCSSTGTLETRLGDIVAARLTR
jgi:hypothetical protein